MASTSFYEQIKQQLADVKAEGLYKSERVIVSPQQAAIKVGGDEVIN